MRIRQRQQTAEEQSAIDELTTNYTIDAISAKCGFTSASTFYTLFAQRFGMTPSEYKKAISKDQYHTSPEA